MLFDFDREPPPPLPFDRVDAVPVFSAVDLLWRSAGHARRRAVGIVQRAVTGAAGVTAAAVTHPVRFGRDAGRAAGSLARFLAPATVPRSSLLSARTLARSLATLDVDLDDLKRAAKAVDGSLNDAFVAAVVGGLQRYHDRHGSRLVDLRMVMPINVRGAGAALGGNHFTPARFVVPADIVDPAARMVELGRIARAVRDEPAVALTDALAGFLNLLPTTVTTAVFGAMLKGADFVTSNVPGAPVPIFMGGARLERMYPFSPLAGSAVNVTLLSHCGTCCIGVNVDAVAVPDLDVLVDCLHESFAEILAVG